jgi:hypothetical protein
METEKQGADPRIWGAQLGEVGETKAGPLGALWAGLCPSLWTYTGSRLLPSTSGSVLVVAETSFCLAAFPLVERAKDL